MSEELDAKVNQIFEKYDQEHDGILDYKAASHPYLCPPWPYASPPVAAPQDVKKLLADLERKGASARAGGDAWGGSEGRASRGGPVAWGGQGGVGMTGGRGRQHGVALGIALSRASRGPAPSAPWPCPVALPHGPVRDCLQGAPRGRARSREAGGMSDDSAWQEASWMR